MMVSIYGKPGCPFCSEAVEYVRDLGIQHTYQKLETSRARGVYNSFGHSTVPVVYIDGLFLGGYDELKAELGTVHHTPLQKISWWVRTAVYYVVDRPRYNLRVKAREDCINSCKI